ncbi:MAG: hypothetical protein ACI9A7_002198 [Cyclobacteriaceae bacterium]|jgi:hypothetical protein
MTKNILLILTIIITGACSSDDDLLVSTDGSIELKFDNIVGLQTSGIIEEPLSQNYPFETAQGQAYNLTLVKYIISEMILEGPNGEYYADSLNVSTDFLSGYYLINESEPTSRNIILENIPAGTYNKVTFTIGVNEEGVSQGTGIFLDGMFWTWNSGYIALKVEGQSPESNGDSFGDTIEESNPFGFGYHIGGWGSINNNQEYTLEFDAVEINQTQYPGVHILMDVANVFNGQNPVDFSITNSVHSPRTGNLVAKNLNDLFSIDHAHQ